MTNNYSIPSSHDPSSNLHPDHPTEPLLPTAPGQPGQSDSLLSRQKSPVDSWLWIVLTVSLAANVILSTAGRDLLGIPFGVAVLGSGIALAVRHHRSK